VLFGAMRGSSSHLMMKILTRKPFSTGFQLELKDATCPITDSPLLPALLDPALRAIKIPLLFLTSSFQQAGSEAGYVTPSPLLILLGTRQHFSSAGGDNE